MLPRRPGACPDRRRSSAPRSCARPSCGRSSERGGSELRRARPRRRPGRAVPELVRRGGRRGRGARGDGARDGDRGRGAVGADGAAEGRDDRGLVFYSHYTSRKGRELEENPQAALLFHWSPLGRQVRVEGRVERVSAADVGCVLRDSAARRAARRARLEPERAARLTRGVGGAARRGRERARRRPVPRPPTWGGFLLEPAAWEFWQHRDSRLHDRFRYERERAGGWRIERLVPVTLRRGSPRLHVAA